MEVQQYLDIKREIQRHLLQFFSDEIVDNENYNKLIQCFQDPTYQKYWSNTKEKLYLILYIIKNYKPTSNLLSKIEKIFFFIQDEIKEKLTNTEIFQIFKSNKMILLYLFKNKILNPDKSILNKYAKEKSIFDYFFPEFKELFEVNQYKKYKGIIKHTTNLQIDDPTDFKLFIEKRNNGQNDHYICQLIQNDLVEEFVSYININNVSLSSIIKPSFFETNNYLLKKQKTTTLIEYAAFYGSIQIFKYLDLNNVEMPSSLWMYAIHSRNAELIHFLEERNVPIPTKSFLKEILKLHDFDITNYFINNNLIQITDKDLSFSIKYCNYSYYPQNLGNSIALYYYNKYNYKNFIEMIIKNGYKFDNDIYYKCKSLTQIIIPFTITSINKKAFQNFSKLKQISIPSSVTSIGPYAFINCISLNKISIPPSVSLIGNDTFYCCVSLKEISIPSSVTSIESSSFHDCSSLIQITIPSKCKYIGNSAFYRCRNLKKVVIPSQLEYLGGYCFGHCKSLEIVSFEIPFSLKIIDEYCFVNCTSLKELWIPYSIEKINTCAFINCSSLNVHIPNSLTSIGNRAFDGCKSCNRF